jgi:hypothetical protein
MSNEPNEEREESPLVVVGAESLAVLARAEIDTQITTAKHYPRNVKKATDEMLTFATEDTQIAASMFYVLPPRGGENKKIQGPSVRLAEVAGSCWGNCRYGARIIDVGEKTVTAQGICYDLEKNIQATVEVKRSITTKAGKRFAEHMVVTVCQAACSIAIREAIFKVIPRAYVNKVYEKARRVSLGEGKTMGERREAAMNWWTKSGATKEQILAAFQRNRVDELTDEDLIELHGLSTSVREGEITLEAALGISDKPDVTSKVKRSGLNDTLNEPVTPQAPQPEPAGEDDPLGGEVVSEEALPDDGGELPLGMDDYRQAIEQAEDVGTELLNIFNDAWNNPTLSEDEKQTVKALCGKRKEALKAQQGEVAAPAKGKTKQKELG